MVNYRQVINFPRCIAIEGDTGVDFQTSPAPLPQKKKISSRPNPTKKLGENPVPFFFFLSVSYSKNIVGYRSQRAHLSWIKTPNVFFFFIILNWKPAYVHLCQFMYVALAFFLAAEAWQRALYWTHFIPRYFCSFLFIWEDNWSTKDILKLRYKSYKTKFVTKKIFHKTKENMKWSKIMSDPLPIFRRTAVPFATAYDVYNFLS